MQGERIATILLLACHLRRLDDCVPATQPGKRLDWETQTNKSNRLLNGGSLFLPLLQMEMEGKNDALDVGRSSDSQMMTDR